MIVYEYLHTTSGGHVDYLAHLIDGFQANGQQVEVVTSKGACRGFAAPTHRVLSSIDVSLPRGTPKWWINRLRVYFAHPRELNRFLSNQLRSSPRAVHFQELPSLRPTSAVNAAHRSGCRVVVTVHNVLPHDRRILGKMRHRLAQRAWGRADALVVHSERLRDQLARVPGIERERIRVARHPVWAVEVAPRGENAGDFLFFGHLRPNKGVLHLLSALACLGDPKTTIAGAGTPEEIAMIRRRIARLGLSRCQFLPGFVPTEAVAGLFARHRVLVAPYVDFAAQSGVTHLGVAHGVPMVVTDVGGLADLVRDFGVGVVVEGDLPHAMKTCLAHAQAGDYQLPLERAAAALHPRQVAKEYRYVFDERPRLGSD